MLIEKIWLLFYLYTSWLLISENFFKRTGIFWMGSSSPKNFIKNLKNEREKFLKMGEIFF